MARWRGPASPTITRLLCSLRAGGREQEAGTGEPGGCGHAASPAATRVTAFGDRRAGRAGEPGIPSADGSLPVHDHPVAETHLGHTADRPRRPAGDTMHPGGPVPPLLTGAALAAGPSPPLALRRCWNQFILRCPPRSTCSASGASGLLSAPVRSRSVAGGESGAPGPDRPRRPLGVGPACALPFARASGPNGARAPPGPRSPCYDGTCCLRQALSALSAVGAPAPAPLRARPSRRVGNTPVLWIDEPFVPRGTGFYAKLEGADPGGRVSRSTRPGGRALRRGGKRPHAGWVLPLWRCVPRKEPNRAGRNALFAARQAAAAIVCGMSPAWGCPVRGNCPA